MYCQYGEPDTDPNRFSHLGFEGIVLVSEDIPEAFEYQKNGKSEREYIDGDRVEVTA
jgi:hypothetical protein